ncbi:hypothetical protein M231_07799 [Tremella mesenterica]|uniref:Major facilitator superfamily (MFS) profile domain-containing protein n=1 Tax=Tremella mesenterica TaxID=5217 RepID=A0A4Q1BFM4_TREME|nr:hypothetical protein M231_07799 [Tremella mesenterica]
MPAAMLLYLFSGLDKGNLGNAKTIGMVGEEGLGADPSGSKYALLNAFYFLGYALFLIPTTLFAKRTKMNIVLGCSGIVWGICASCTAAVNTYGQAEATRFLVGFGESGYGPVIPGTPSESLLCALRSSCAPVPSRQFFSRLGWNISLRVFLGFITGLIAYGVTFTHSRVEPWRLLFIIEGVPAIVAGLYALWILPGDLLITKRLTEKERACALVRIGRGGSHESHKINWKHALNTLISWQILLRRSSITVKTPRNVPKLTYLSIIVVGAAIGAFLPTLVADVGYTGAIAQVYTLPPYGTAAIVMLIVAWVSDRYGKRGPGMLLGMGMMSMGFAMLVGLKPDHHAGRYAALVFCETGQFITIPLNLTWVAENSGNGSRRAFALPFVIACAQALAIASGYMFPAKDKPVYHLGSSVCLSLTSLGFAVSLLYIFLLRRANAKKDAEEGPVDPTLVPDTATYADKARGFRYVW